MILHVGVYINLKLAEGDARDSPFNENIYFIAAVLDPSFGFMWLECDHPGTDDVKDDLRIEIRSWILECSKELGVGPGGK